MEERFISILTQNKDAIFRICRSYAPGRADAEDIFQEVLLNIWKSLPDFRADAAASTWVYRITLNVCLRTKHRRDKQHKPLSLDGLNFEPPADSQHPPDYHLLYDCISLLGDADKAIMLLFLEDLPYKEIAATTGISENLVAVKLKRIKTKLFTCLKEKGYER